MRAFWLAGLVVLAGCGKDGREEKAKDGKPAAVRDDPAELDEAKIRAVNLAMGLMAYYGDHEKFPGRLAELSGKSDRGGPYVSEEAMVDPWGKPYQFDPEGKRNNGSKPDVFTTSPGGKVVGNWRD
jgi:hypothetical protein